MSNEESLPPFTLFGLDDVENYGLVSGDHYYLPCLVDFSEICVVDFDWLLVQVSEADNSLPLDIHNQVFQLVEKGNDAFKESRFEEVNESISLSLL